MRFFNKYFFIGLVAGVALIIILILFGSYIFVKKMTPDQAREIMLFTPNFPTSSERTLYGQVDYNWTIQTPDGKKVTLSEFKNKVLFINLWASWCNPCVVEMPGIQRLYDSLKNEEVAFLLISDEDESTVRHFIKNKKFNFPVYLRTGDVPNVFITRGIPATFIVDKEGAIVFKHIGFANWDDESTRSFIRSLL